MSEESFRAENSTKSESSPEKKKKKLPKEVKSSTFASTLAVIIIIAAIVIGGGYYLQSKSADENKNQELSEAEEQYQAQLNELNDQIKNLEEKDRLNKELIQRDLPEAAKLVLDCSQEFEPKYKEYDEKIPFYLNYNNRPFQYYQKQGYQLKQACHSNEKFLMLLDSQKTYNNLIVKQVATPEVARASAKLVLGISDKMFFQMNYYPVKIDEYNFEEGNKTYCIFDDFVDNNILYVCLDEKKENYYWYIFDTVKKINHKIKIQTESETEVFDEASLDKFFIKEF